MKIGRFQIPHNSIIYQHVTERELNHHQALTLLLALEACDRRRLKWITDYRTQSDPSLYNPALHKRAKILIKEVEALVPGYTSVRRYGYGLLASYETQVSKKKLLGSPSLMQHLIKSATGQELEDYLAKFMGGVNEIFSLSVVGDLTARKAALSVITRINRLIKEYNLNVDLIEPGSLDRLRTKYGQSDDVINLESRHFRWVLTMWLANVLSRLDNTQRIFVALMIDLADYGAELEVVVVRSMDVLPDTDTEQLPKMTIDEVRTALANNERCTHWLSFYEQITLVT